MINIINVLSSYFWLCFVFHALRHVIQVLIHSLLCKSRVRDGNWIWDLAPMTSHVSIYNVMMKLWGDAATRQIQSIQLHFPKWVTRPIKSLLNGSDRTGNVGRRTNSLLPCCKIIPLSHRGIDFGIILKREQRDVKLRAIGALPYPGWVLLHLVLVAMGTIGMATPEAALAELVAMALLAPVPETHHALAPAIWTFHRMEDWAVKKQKRYWSSVREAETSLFTQLLTKPLHTVTLKTVVPNLFSSESDGK